MSGSSEFSPYEEAFQILDDAVFAVDENHQVIFINDAAARLYGISSEDVVGKPFEQVIDPDGERTAPSVLSNFVGTCRMVLLPSDQDTLANHTIKEMTLPDGSIVQVHLIRPVEGADQLLKIILDWQNRFRAIADLSPVGVYLCDPQGNNTFASGTWCKIAGMSPEEASGRGWVDAVHPEDQPQVLENWEPLLSTEEGGGVEYRMVDREGHPTWVHGFAIPINDRKGRVIHYLGFVKDITPQKAIEDALRESERKFRLITETIEDVFWISTPGIAEMLYISPAYEGLWGRSCQSLYNKPTSFLEAIHPDDRIRIEAAKNQHTQGVWDYEYRIVRPDGSIRWIRDRGFPVHDDEGSLIMMTGVARDVTDQKKLENDRLQTEKRYRELVEGTGDLIFLIDADARISFVNKRAEKFFGMPTEQCLGRPGLEFIHPEDRNATLEAGKKWFAEKKTFVTYENRQISQTGQVYHMHWSLQQRFDEDGKSTGFSGIGRDVSSQKRAQELLSQAHEEIKRQVENGTLELSRTNVELRMFKAIIEASSEAVAVGSPDGIPLYVNPAAEELLGISIDAERLNELRQASPKETLILLEKHVIPRLIEGKGWQGELALRHKSGRKITVWMHANSVLNEDREIAFTVGFMHDVTREKQAEEALKKSETILAEQNELLERKNVALTELMHRLEEEKQRVERRVQANVERLLRPLLSALRARSTTIEAEYMNLIEQNLAHLTSPFGASLTDRGAALTKREIEIANMIRTGLTSKEIAGLLRLSVRSIENHRKNIRKKLGITNEKINLVSFLQTMSDHIGHKT
jgi:PAS domain S-box-containing protein